MFKFLGFLLLYFKVFYLIPLTMTLIVVFKGKIHHHYFLN